jgi:hypothetical protein
MDIIYREEFDRWVKGDRYIRPAIRRVLRGNRHNLSGMQRVVKNFLIGLDRKGVSYNYNRFSFLIGKSRKIISFGLGINGVKGLNKGSPIIAAIGFPYPGDLPDLCEKYNVKKFLQHSQWVLDFVRSAGCYDEQIFDLWPAGIDTEEWRPVTNSTKKNIDVLIYNKVCWDMEDRNKDLLQPIRELIASKNLSVSEIIYGHYSTDEYRSKLARARTMIFISAHESQGLAYQECLSCDVPVMAWNPGYWLDPVRFSYHKPVVPATSVPFFDSRCGVTFEDYEEFKKKFDLFYEDAMLGKFNPREYVLENISIEKSTDRMLEIYNSI